MTRKLCEQTHQYKELILSSAYTCFIFQCLKVVLSQPSYYGTVCQSSLSAWHAHCYNCITGKQIIKASHFNFLCMDAYLINMNFPDLQYSGII